MKVLLLTDGIFPYVMGGMQKHSYNLFRHLHKAGVDVHLAHCVYANNPMPSPEQVGSSLGIDPIKIRGFRFPNSLPYPGHYVVNSYLYSKLLFESYGKDLDAWDLIYAQGFTGLYFLKPGVQEKLWVNLHGLEMLQPAYSLKERLQQLLLRRPALQLVRGAWKVQSLGGKLTDLLQEWVSKDRLVTCGIGIDSSWLRPPEQALSGRPKKGLSFLFVGRNETRKGLTILYSAIQILEKKGVMNPDITFHFIGPIPASQQFLKPYCKYYGAIKEEHKIQDVMRQCDLMLLPSLSEGMPTVILEAMASGMAIIASDVGAVSVLVDAQTGRLTQPGSPESLAEAIADYISMPNQRLLGQKKASLKKVEAFIWPRIIQEHIRLFAMVGQ